MNRGGPSPPRARRRKVPLRRRGVFDSGFVLVGRRVGIVVGIGGGESVEASHGGVELHLLPDVGEHRRERVFVARFGARIRRREAFVLGANGAAHEEVDRFRVGVDAGTKRGGEL